jgi:sugar lactone lactonase YvrE
MMKKILFLGLVTFFFFSGLVGPGVQQARADDASDAYTVTKQWETQQELRIPESVLYDEARNILYVSNINGKSAEKNGQGFISKVSLDGKIKVLKWVKGLNAPKGMALFKDRLYVADIDRVVEIDVERGKVTARHPAPGAQFLNDVAVDASGNVYVSDMSSANSVIYQLSNGSMTVWVKGPEINMPNGLYMEEKRLLVGNFADRSLKAVTRADKSVHTLVKVGSPIDGLRGDGKGNYFISDWQGKTSLVTASGHIIVVIDTTASHINAADLEYIPSKGLLLIPTFSDNRIVAYTVEEAP